MKRIFKQKFELAAILFVGLLVGCSSDDTSILNTPTGEEGGPTTPETATIRITQGGAADDNFVATAMGVAGETTEGRVIFTTTDSKQRRMYVTQQLPGESPMPFDLPLTNKGTKADGSIDLDGQNTSAVDFTFTLNVPSAVTDGAIVYQFWTTTGRGDFRDPSKRNILGDAALNVGTITVTVGTGNVSGSVASYSGIELKAPLNDGTSPSFISLLNPSIVYRIDQGPEFASYWDFGYYYGASNNATLASASMYPTNIIDIVARANEKEVDSSEEPLTSADLNEMFIGLSTLSSVDFDSATNADLNAIIKPTTMDVKQLASGDILEFEGVSGRKGLIRVVSIVGTDGSTGTLTIDIKVQQ